DLGSRHVENGPAVAAAAEGGIDIDAAFARLQHLYRLAEQYRNMTRGLPAHPPPPRASRPDRREPDASCPMTPRTGALGVRGFCNAPPPRAINSFTQPRPQTLFSA